MDRGDSGEDEDETIVVPEIQMGEQENNNNEGEKSFRCQFCLISFGDAVLYTMHMGYHGYKEPFTCNMCGEPCENKVAFFVHIARISHS